MFGFIGSAVILLNGAQPVGGNQRHAHSHLPAGNGFRQRSLGFITPFILLVVFLAGCGGPEYGTFTLAEQSVKKGTSPAILECSGRLGCPKTIYSFQTRKTYCVYEIEFIPAIWRVDKYKNELILDPGRYTFQIYVRGGGVNLWDPPVEYTTLEFVAEEGRKYGMETYRDKSIIIDVESGAIVSRVGDTLTEQSWSGSCINSRGTTGDWLLP